MEADGFQVIRFWNNEVLENTDDVVHAIYLALPDGMKRERG